jgi:hypothetical protein
MKSTSTLFFASLLACSLSMADVAPRLLDAFRQSAGIVLAPQDTVQGKKSKGRNVQVNVGSRKKGNQVYINTDDNKREELNYDGDITLSEDFKDIKSISPNGYLRYVRSVNDETKRIEITSDANGKLTRKYSENGKTVAYEPAGRQWLQQVMPDLMATTGIGAEQLVKDIYKKSGAKGVLAETQKISSEYGKARIVNYLLQQPGLKPAEVQLALQHIAENVSSDYELRKALDQVAAASLNNKEVTDAYLQVTGKINSDYERRKALMHLLETPNLSNASMAKALEQTGKINSDYEKAKVLQQLSAKPDFIKNNYKPAFEVIDKISSDYEKSKTIDHIVKAHKLSQAQYKELLPVVARINSDYEKGKVLRSIAAGIPSDATALRNDVAKTADTINSEYEKKKVMDALR